MSKEHAQSLYPSNGSKPDIGVLYHNVGYGVLRGSDEATQQRIHEYYGSRGGHLPDGYESAVLVPDAGNVEVQKQFEYLSEAMDRNIRVIDISAYKNLKGRILLNPYINIDTVSRDHSGPDIVVWGLPHELTDRLKNKVHSNTDIQRLSEETDIPLAIPDMWISHIRELPEVGLTAVTQIQAMYDQYTPEYNQFFGVIFRNGEADGGYGNVVMKRTKEGYWDVCPNAGEVYQLQNIEDALLLSQNFLRQSMNEAIEPRVVINRLIEKEDSPGMSVLFLGGEVHSLGWNGQIPSKSGEACVGTMKYVPTNEYLRRYQDRHEEESAWAFAQYVYAVSEAQGIDPTSIHGIANVDIMIPGKLEQLFLARSNRNPDVVYVAECNPRWTNYSDAVSLVAWVKGFPLTVEGFKQVIQEGIVAVDKVPHSQKSRDSLRNAVKKTSAQMGEKDGAILRMPSEKTAGIIYYGNTDVVEQRILQEIS